MNLRYLHARMSLQVCVDLVVSIAFTEARGRGHEAGEVCDKRDQCKEFFCAFFLGRIGRKVNIGHGNQAATSIVIPVDKLDGVIQRPGELFRIHVFFFRKQEKNDESD